MATDRHQSPSYPLRMTDELKAQVQTAADESGRSLHAELIHRVGRTFEADETVKLLRGNMVLLRGLADFVVLRHRHPDVMAGPMEQAMVAMARAVNDTKDDAMLFDVAAPAFRDYVMALANSVNNVTDLLGPGWAKTLAPMPDEPAQSSDTPNPRPKLPTGPKRPPNARNRDPKK